MNCESCKFWAKWVGNEEHPNRGNCHRYPPQVIGITRRVYSYGSEDIYDEGQTEFPETDNDDWCGEFQL